MLRLLAYLSLLLCLTSCTVVNDAPGTAAGVSIDANLLRANGWMVYGKDDESAAMRELYQLKADLDGQHGEGDILFAIRRSQGRVEVVLWGVAVFERTY